MLRISGDLALPDDAVTQAMAILARRGAGKTYCAAVLVEECVKARLPVVVLDPLGAFWGLRSSADGLSEGLPVVILGGDHGDVSLERTAGRLIADLVVDHPGAYVVDFSAFESKAAEIQFATDFLERLYRAKSREKSPLLLVVDEADTFAPQRTPPAEPGKPSQQRTLGALEAIVRRGRIRGLGVMLISQRAAVLNKNVLTQCEVLIAMQTTGPQDRKAIDEWIEGNGRMEDRATIMGSLASLETGEAWVWSPSWLRITQRVRIRRRETFDSSKTPEMGLAAVPHAFAKVDLDALGSEIAATREKERLNDPKELRRRIADLERLAITYAPEPPEVRVERVEVERLVKVPDYATAEQADRHLSLIEVEIAKLRGWLQEVRGANASAIHRLELNDLSRPTPAEQRRMAPPAPPERTSFGVGDVFRVDGKPFTPSDYVKLGKAERLILAALVQYPQGRSQKQLGVITGYAWSGGGFNNAIGSLRTKGLIRGGRDLISITEDGSFTASALGMEELPRGRALFDHWMGQLGKAERLILEHLASTYPKAVDRESLAEATGYAPTGGGFNNALGRLRTFELIERGELRASANLFG